MLVGHFSFQPKGETYDGVDMRPADLPYRGYRDEATGRAKQKTRKGPSWPSGRYPVPERRTFPIDENDYGQPYQDQGCRSNTLEQIDLVNFFFYEQQGNMNCQYKYMRPGVPGRNLAIIY